MNRRASTLLWDDVPPDQRATPAEDARYLLALSKAPRDRVEVLVQSLMLPTVRTQLDHLRRVESGAPHCHMATRQTYDRARRVWLYRPCAIAPSNGFDFCVHHGGPKKH